MDKGIGGGRGLMGMGGGRRVMGDREVEGG